MEKHSAYQQKLIQAQIQARSLLDWIETQLHNWVGLRESQIVDRVEEQCRARFDCDKYWHRSIVRTGANTVLGFGQHGPDLEFDGSLIFFDLGPVFQNDEADFGKTFTLQPEDSVASRLCRDSQAIHRVVKDHLNSSMTGADVYHRVVAEAGARGWVVRVPTLGHIVGEFPHQSLGKGTAFKIFPENHEKIVRLDSRGRRLEWILEVHIQDSNSLQAAFFEDFLTL